MRRDRRFLTSTCVLACSILLAGVEPLAAHPGHGSIDASLPLHYLATPEHAAPWMVGLTIAVLALAAYRWAKKNAPLNGTIE
jgi:hypothetical protein